MANHLDKFAQEANKYLNQLAGELGHPEEVGQTYILLRAVLHTVRDRIQISESFHLLSQLPMFLKGVYVEHWVYSEKPLKLQTLEEFKDAVKQEQERLGEQQFNWSEHTEELISKVLASLGTHYLSQGQLNHIATQMPKEMQPLFAA